MLYQVQNPHGGDRYGRPVRLDFSANTNPLGTPEGVRQAVLRSAARLDRYPDPYCRALVEAIARFEETDREHILCGCGAAELIFSYCAALRPQTALELAPTFSEYSAAAEAFGCRVERFPLEAEQGFVPGETLLRRLEQGNWEVLFLCNPNNPTGQVIPPVLLEEIAEVCRKRGIRLFLDECFLDLSDGGRGQSLKKRLERQPELLILKAFTKSYGMAGLRLGYCMTADRALLAAMSRQAQPWNVSLPAQEAGVAALEEQAFLQRSRAVIREERAWLTGQLEELGIRVNPSQANYLLLYSPLPLGRLLGERGIQLRDCSNYHGLGAGWFRIAVRPRAENRELISALRSIVEEN